MKKEINQEIISVLENHEQRIQKNTNDIKSLKERILKLENLVQNNKN